jgi:serine/threonine protein phosphatase PrpC
MGSCCHSKLVKNIEVAEYLATADLKIKERDKKGNHRGTSYVKLELNPPSDQDYSIFDIGPYKFRVFTSIIPGQDPRGESKKPCQDNCGFAIDSGIFFGILFDGHGKEGHKVSEFCKDFMLRFFLSNPEKFEENAEKAIEEVVTLADKELLSSKIDIKFSGSTAVVIVLKPDSIYIGSLGDSRAVLGTLPKDDSESSTMTSLNTGKALEAKNFINSKKSKTKKSKTIFSSRTLNSVALTMDQKPNHEEELKRIRKAGGIVERVTNDKGQAIGPYRIWRRRGNGPGLAMSRSMGDTVAHEIGVISTPIVSRFDLYPGVDQFIVVASDGIWDAMENSDAVHFIDRFRPDCFLSGSAYPARSNNSSIARLLCEEARARWLRIVEEEDVMIDDISCIVIELTSVEPGNCQSQFKVKERKLESRISMTLEDTVKSDNLDPARKDMVRGSIVEASEEEFGE